MVANLPRRPGRGGNRHPIAVKQFILDHLAKVGEDCTSGMHQAYNNALDQLAIARLQEGGKRKVFYEHPVYASFRRQMGAMIHDEMIEFSGREEPTDQPNFADPGKQTMRKYYRLTRR